MKSKFFQHILRSKTEPISETEPSTGTSGNISMMETLEQTASNKIPPALISELHGVEELQKVFEVLSTRMGVNFLNDKNLYNIINDLSKVMRSHSQYRYILRGLFEWQIFKIQSLATITYAQIIDESNKFSTKTGFSNELVFEVFIAIAKGLGNKIDASGEKEEIQENSISTSLQIAKTNTASSSQHTNTLSVSNGNTIASPNWSFIKEKVEKAIDYNVVILSSTDSNPIAELKQNLYIIPEWNNIYGVNIKNIDFEEDYKKKLKVSYKILGTNNIKKSYTDTSRVSVYLLILDKNGIPREKVLLSSIDTAQKYAIEQGNICFDFELNRIGSLLVVPMFDEISNSTYSLSSENINFEEFKGELSIEIVGRHYPYDELSINTPFVFGCKNICLLCFSIEGRVRFNSGYKVGNTYGMAIFDKNDELIERKSIFVGKKGFVGSRGGLYKTNRYGGIVKYIFLEKIRDLSCDFSEVAKIIISED